MDPNMPLNFTGILECLRTIWTNPLLRSQSYWQELKSTRNSMKTFDSKLRTSKQRPKGWGKMKKKTRENKKRAQHSTRTHLFNDLHVYFSHAYPDELFE